MSSKFLRSTKTQTVFLNSVHPPFRAELPRKRIGEWRSNIEEAMQDARAYGSGSRVVSSEGVLLARFDNAVRFAGPIRKSFGEEDAQRGEEEKLS